MLCPWERNFTQFSSSVQSYLTIGQRKILSVCLLCSASQNMAWSFSWIMWLFVCFQMCKVRGKKGTTEGKLFVFSYSPTLSTKQSLGYRLKPLITTSSIGSVSTRIQCKRFCGDGTTDGTTLTTLSVHFGEVNQYNIILSLDSKKFSPYNQTVYTISSVRPVVVFLIDIYYASSADCAMLYPDTAADLEYITITLGSSLTFIQIVTLTSKTSIQIKAKDQYDIYERYAKTSGLKPRDHDLCMKSIGGCNDQKYPVSSVTTVENIEYDKILTYNLDSFQALTLFRNAPDSCCDFSGYEITSDKPVIVKVGTDTTSFNLADNKDNTFEFLPAKKYLGKSFIIPRNNEIEVKSNIKILTAADSNEISMECSGSSDVEKASLEKKGDWVSKSVDGKENIAILATQGTLVGLLLYKTSDGTGPCFTIIFPILLWSDSYIWADVDIDSETIYTTIVAQESHKDGVILDKKQKLSFTTFTLNNLEEKKWASYTSLTTNGSHVAYNKNTGDNFMILIFGFSDKLGYCTVPGITFREINSKTCIPTRTIPGDNIDNDCDGKFDEEFGDGKDNDNDNKVDEDIKKKPRINGEWASWISNSDCIVECGVTDGQMFGEIRHCNNPKPENDGLPCEGESTKSQGTSCNLDLVLCSDQCKPFTYGYNCSKNCDKCDDPCDPETGSCTYCKPGFAPPFCNKTCTNNNCNICSSKGSCSKCNRGFFHPPDCDSCPDGKYGEDCLEMCTTNCISCHGDTGECLKCETGLKPPTCVQKCTKEDCSICTKNDVCTSCKPGYTKPPNCFPCPMGTYGVACKKTCAQNCISCDGETGECHECEINFKLPNCDKCSPGYNNAPICAPCPNGTYGVNCAEKCFQNCFRCQGDTGECNECDINFKFPECENCSRGYTNQPECSPCTNGTFGDDCTEKCPKNCNVCHGETGVCLECEINFNLPNCDKCSRGFALPPLCLPCSDGSFGDDCSETCLPDYGCAKCDGKTGQCTMCKTSYIFPSCNTSLPFAGESAFQSKGLVAALLSLLVVFLVLTAIFALSSNENSSPKKLNSESELDFRFYKSYHPKYTPRMYHDR